MPTRPGWRKREIDMYAVMNTNKRTGVVSEVSRHADIEVAVAALEALEFKRDASVFAITTDADGDEGFDPINWQDYYASKRA